MGHEESFQARTLSARVGSRGVLGTRNQASDVDHQAVCSALRSRTQRTDPAAACGRRGTGGRQHRNRGRVRRYDVARGGEQSKVKRADHLADAVRCLPKPGRARSNGSPSPASGLPVGGAIAIPASGGSSQTQSATKPAGAARLSAPQPALLPSNSFFVVAKCRRRGAILGWAIIRRTYWKWKAPL
jgi:hypothetical protein